MLLGEDATDQTRNESSADGATHEQSTDDKADTGAAIPSLPDVPTTEPTEPGLEQPEHKKAKH